MAEPMRIRAQVHDDVAEIKILMNHPMETGRRKQASGELVPSHFIQSVAATLNGKKVLDAQWGVAVSKNPFLGFRVKGAKVGDELVVSWIDSRGDKRTDKAVLEAKPSS
jgi:sulfur-oxidizing protein SoxZ